MSDRDILIVDNDVSILRKRTRILEAEGWSVAPYTYAKLQALAAHGALFVQHLKLESTILRDRDGHLARVLNDFQPFSNYKSQIRDNDRLARLSGIASNGPGGILLAADILYVSVRNFGVLSLAERGIHTYAYSAVLEALEAEWILPIGGARALSDLRFLKCQYRGGEWGCAGRAREVVDQALAALPCAHFPRKLRLADPRAIVTEPPPRGAATSYFQMRDLERRLVALNTLAPHATASGDLIKLSKWIGNPRAYASISSRLAPRLRIALKARLEPKRPTVASEGLFPRIAATG
jgi:hypothetical protein